MIGNVGLEMFRNVFNVMAKNQNKLNETHQFDLLRQVVMELVNPHTQTHDWWR